MREMLLEVSETDMEAVEEIGKQLATEECFFLRFKKYAGQVWDEVFFPTPKKKIIYTVPEGRILFCLVNNFDKHKILKKRVEKAGIAIEEKIINFL